MTPAAALQVQANARAQLPALRTCSPFTSTSAAGRPLGRKSFAGAHVKGSRSNGSTVVAAQWLENSAEMEVQVPLELAWDLWEDRESIPKFMPWIKSVTVQPDDPKMSRWLLSTNQFGRDWEFSWLAQNLTPIRNQKIHWRSVQGSTGGSMGSTIDIANRGQIRFYRKSPQSCNVKLTISYELPGVLVPFGNSLTPLVEGILSRDMQRFSQYALQKQQERQTV